MKDLIGKVAVVTGAASGIGRAVGVQFGSVGMKVVLADVHEDSLNATADDLRAGGLDVHPVVTDVTSEDSVRALAAATIERYGNVHVLHNNAGVIAGGRIEQVDAATWDWVMGVDLWGVLYGIHAFLPLLESNGADGHVVNTASTAGLQAAPGIAPYAVAKAGVIALSETLALELADRGSPIGVSVLCPNVVKTALFSDREAPPAVVASRADAQADAEFRRSKAALVAAKGMEPADVAAAVLDAVLEDRFWVVTHTDWYAILEDRVREMRAGRLHHATPL